MEELIVIGRIGAPHGVRGEVRIVPLTDFPGRFENLRRVFIDGGKEAAVTAVKYNKQWIILKFQGVDDRDGADLLKGKLLKVERKDVPPLQEGEYYSFDIIGLEVFDERETSLGKIVEILKTGSNDVYVAEQAGKQTLIPALKKVVTSIDLAARTMRVALPEEME